MNNNTSGSLVDTVYSSKDFFFLKIFMNCLKVTYCKNSTWKLKQDKNNSNRKALYENKITFLIKLKLNFLENQEGFLFFRLENQFLKLHFKKFLTLQAYYLLDRDRWEYDMLLMEGQRGCRCYHCLQQINGSAAFYPINPLTG